jgi:hypothetical protein
MKILGVTIAFVLRLQRRTQWQCLVTIAFVLRLQRRTQWKCWSLPKINQSIKPWCEVIWNNFVLLETGVKIYNINTVSWNLKLTCMSLRTKPIVTKHFHWVPLCIAFVLRLQRRTQWKCWSLSPLFLGYRGELNENVWSLSPLFLGYRGEHQSFSLSSPL